IERIIVGNFKSKSTHCRKQGFPPEKEDHNDTYGDHFVNRTVKYVIIIRCQVGNTDGTDQNSKQQLVDQRKYLLVVIYFQEPLQVSQGVEVVDKKCLTDHEDQHAPGQDSYYPVQVFCRTFNENSRS